MIQNYEIMSGDTLVALWKNGKFTVVCKKLLPLYLCRVHNPDMWLETRAIDGHRANSRLLKKALRLAEKDDLSIVIHVNGATVTDNYWIRPIGSELKYSDVCFSDDYFSTLALKGTYNSFNRAASAKNSRTPELTAVGSFEKCWKLYGGKWEMLKRANHDEMFSELFVCRLGKALGMDMADYFRGDGFIRTSDFTDGKFNFEPASAFMGDNEDYSDVAAKLSELCPDALPDYVKMIFLDTLVANPDRHTNNFGLLRDRQSGELLRLAPNFDNNMALISRGYPALPKKGDMLVELFNDFMSAHPEYKKFILAVSEQTVRDCVRSLNMKVKTDYIVRFITERCALIEK